MGAQSRLTLGHSWGCYPRLGYRSELTGPHPGPAQVSGASDPHTTFRASGILRHLGLNTPKQQPALRQPEAPRCPLYPPISCPRVWLGPASPPHLPSAPCRPHCPDSSPPTAMTSTGLCTGYCPAAARSPLGPLEEAHSSASAHPPWGTCPAPARFLPGPPAMPVNVHSQRSRGLLQPSLYTSCHTEEIKTETALPSK